MLWYIIAHFNQENTCQYLAFDRSQVNNISIHMAAIKCKVLARVLDIRYQCVFYISQPIHSFLLRHWKSSICDVTMGRTWLCPWQLHSFISHLWKVQIYWLWYFSTYHPRLVLLNWPLGCRSWATEKHQPQVVQYRIPQRHMFLSLLYWTAWITWNCTHMVHYIVQTHQWNIIMNIWNEYLALQAGPVLGPLVIYSANYAK